MYQYPHPACHTYIPSCLYKVLDSTRPYSQHSTVPSCSFRHCHWPARNVNNCCAPAALIRCSLPRFPARGCVRDALSTTNPIIINRVRASVHTNPRVSKNYFLSILRNLPGSSVTASGNPFMRWPPPPTCTVSSLPAGRCVFDLPASPPAPIRAFVPSSAHCVCSWPCESKLRQSAKLPTCESQNPTCPSSFV